MTMCGGSRSIGCGLSDKPQEWDYRLAQHIDNLCWSSIWIYKYIVLVVHDWGGAIGMGMAGRMPERIAKMVVTNTAAFGPKRFPCPLHFLSHSHLWCSCGSRFNAFAGVATWRATARELFAQKSGLTMPYNSWANRIAHLEICRRYPT